MLSKRGAYSHVQREIESNHTSKNYGNLCPKRTDLFPYEIFHKYIKCTCYNMISMYDFRVIYKLGNRPIMLQGFIRKMLNYGSQEASYFYFFVNCNSALVQINTIPYKKY